VSDKINGNEWEKAIYTHHDIKRREMPERESISAFLTFASEFFCGNDSEEVVVFSVKEFSAACLFFKLSSIVVEQKGTSLGFVDYCLALQVSELSRQRFAVPVPVVVLVVLLVFFFIFLQFSSSSCCCCCSSAAAASSSRCRFSPSFS